MQESTGYKGRALDLINTAGASIGDKVNLTGEGESVEGLLMPRVAGEDDSHIVLKLATGYNVGVKISGKARIQVLGTGAKPALSSPPTPA